MQKKTALEKGLKLIGNDFFILSYFKDVEGFLMKEGLNDYEVSVLKEFIKEYYSFEHDLDLAIKMFIDKDYKNALFQQMIEYKKPILSYEKIIEFVRKRFKVGYEVPEFDNEDFKKAFIGTWEFNDCEITGKRKDLEELTEKEKKKVKDLFFFKIG